MSFLVFLPFNSPARAIQLPGGTVSIPVNNGAGVGFSLSGLLTEGDTIAFSASGIVCNLPGYCTNQAGVTVPPSPGISGSFSFDPCGDGHFPLIVSAGATVMKVAGTDSTTLTPFCRAVQVFPATTANGLGSNAPPLTLVLPPTSLASLGFPRFAISDPLITFLVADEVHFVELEPVSGYYDNTGGPIVLAQQNGPSPLPVPAISRLGLMALAILLVGAGGRFVVSTSRGCHFF